MTDPPDPGTPGGHRGSNALRRHDLCVSSPRSGGHGGPVCQGDRDQLMCGPLNGGNGKVAPKKNWRFFKVQNWGKLNDWIYRDFQISKLLTKKLRRTVVYCGILWYHQEAIVKQGCYGGCSIPTFNLLEGVPGSRHHCEKHGVLFFSSFFSGCFFLISFTEGT